MPKPTYYAKILANELKKRGIDVQLEHNDGYKSVDIFIPSIKLDIEVDGNQHITDSYQALTDLKRTKNSLKEGRITIRIPNAAIYQNVLGVADNISEIVTDLRSKTKEEKVKELIKKKGMKPLENTKFIFNYSKVQQPTERKNETKKKTNWRKYFLVGIIFLAIILIGYFVLNNGSKNNDIKNPSQNNENTNFIPEQTKVELIIVSGSKTEVIIKNNQQKSISVNVTYRIYSDWFGKDSIESNVFEVDADEEKSFRVYNNDGCNTAPCSVSIINFEEVYL